MNSDKEIFKLVSRLLDNGYTDAGILIGFVAETIREGRAIELRKKIEEVLPEYTSKSPVEILLRDSINLN
jgi:hypothetical protein